MQDLVIHSVSSFTLPETITEDTRVSLAQAYIGLFLTVKGSIDVDENTGVNFAIGSVNTDVMDLYIDQIHTSILDMMRVPYGLTSIDVLDLTIEDDSLKMTVKLTTITVSETITITL